MARTTRTRSTPRKRKPASAPLTDPNPTVAVVSAEDSYRAWRDARTEQVFSPVQYSAVTDLFEDYKLYTAATLGTHSVMKEVEFGLLTKAWMHHRVEMMPIRRATGVKPDFGACLNRRLIDARQAAA